MKIFGKVVDIGSRGTTVNDQSIWFFNEKGQAFMFYYLEFNLVNFYPIHVGERLDLESP